MRIVYTSALVCSLLAAPVPAARADLPVVDVAQLKAWATQAEQMAQQVEQMVATVHSLTDVPQDLASMVQQLLQTAVQNPLGAITQNLQVLLTGQGVGTCTGGQAYLTQNQYSAAQGTDFTAQIMNQSANRNAGLQACTQQMLAATQTRLQQMPQLLNQLQGATDATQVAAIAGRITYEVATINAQQQQAIAMGQAAQVQAAMAQDQLLQKQRSDATEIINSTAPGAAAGTIPSVTPAPNLFTGG
jgi:Type IV secretion system proteins